MVAAGVVGFDDSLIFHTRQMYTEVLYTPLLLVTLMVLLWALTDGAAAALCVGRGEHGRAHAVSSYHHAAATAATPDAPVRLEPQAEGRGLPGL